MSNPSLIHNTFVIERSFPASPEKVFAAFSNPAAKRIWFAEGQNHEVEQFDMDFRVGGAERTFSRFNEGSPFPGVALINDSNYLDIIPNQRIVAAATMSLGDRRISASLVTFELLPTAAGTDLVFTHQAAFFEGSDGPQIREHGWRTLLDKLSTQIA